MKACRLVLCEMWDRKPTRKLKGLRHWRLLCAIVSVAVGLGGETVLRGADPQPIDGDSFAEAISGECDTFQVVALRDGVESRSSGETADNSVKDETPPPLDAKTETAEKGDEASAESTVEQLVAEVRESIVTVSFMGRDGKPQGIGTGFVISADGLIATNLHVIGEARPISVQTVDGKEHAVQAVHASDKTLDLALLKIDAGGLSPLVLGDSDTLKQGQPVVAIGNPRGLKHSVVSGVVSGRRDIDGKPMIQLAIPIEQGNSGGPLLDLQGQVHGILTLKSLVTENLGFAVAINTLKPLLEQPNPVPMARWLTIGTLSPKEWTPLFGANWRQRAGRISVDGGGHGFGRRALCLSAKEVPEMPFEVAVSVRLNQEEGAAGLVFHADGGDKHYGFYPSNGQLRLSRFDGPDVFSWQVLEQVRTPHYRPGEWNDLKVRVDKNKIQCFVNEELVIESTDSQYLAGRAGLAKFRETEAEFKRFRVAKEIPSRRPSEEVVQRIEKLTANLSPNSPPSPDLADSVLLADPASSRFALHEQARQLEQQAERLRQLADLVHQQTVYSELTSVFDTEEPEIDLLKASLLIARLDNEDLEIDVYLETVDRMVDEMKESLPEDADDTDRLKALDHYLFEELGFHGSRTDYYNRSNSYLNEVLDDREGLPITLSVLYMEMGRRLGVRIEGVGLPGHFVVRHKPADGEPQLIDVFDRGKRLGRDEAAALVRGTAGRELNDDDLHAQPKKAILLRMLRNLLGVARNQSDVESMLRYVEGIVALEPQSVEDRWFRAVLRFQAQRIEAALDDTGWLLEQQPDGVDLRRVRELHQLLENARP